MQKLILVLFTSLLLSACSVSEQEVEREFNRFLGESFEGQFTILDSRYSFAIGDDVSTVDLKFTKKGNKRLLSILKNKNVTKFEGGFQYEKQIQVQSGYDFFLLTVRNDSENIRLQYGNE